MAQIIIKGDEECILVFYLLFRRCVQLHLQL